MEHDDKLKQDRTATRRRCGSAGGRATHYLGAGRCFTPEEIRKAVQRRIQVMKLKQEQRKQALPPGALRIWHWRAMVTAWKARPQGVKASGGLFADYGNIAQKVWRGLLNYQGGALVETYETPGNPWTSSGYNPHIYWLRLTTFGEQFYRDNWQRYRELYPDIDAPAPDKM